ncbi:hypothetical protein BG003_010565 [Podila horticola]|nr:hypothetical protein BG003_010565 [Podila horticola]
MKKAESEEPEENSINKPRCANQRTMKYIILLVAAIAAIGSTAAAPTAMIPDALAGGAEVQCCMCEHPFRPRCSKSCCADSN